MVPTTQRVAMARASAWRQWSGRLGAAADALVRPGGVPPRVLVGLAGGLAASLLAAYTPGSPGDFRPTAAAAFGIGAAFGAPAIAALGVAEAGVALALGGSVVQALLTAFADALLGAVAYLCFRDLSGVGRSIHDLGSYLTLLAGCLVGSLATALFLSWLDFSDHLLQGLGLYAVGNISAVVLGGLPLLVASDRWARPWMEPMPGEIEAPPMERLGEETLDPDAPPEDVEATMVVARRGITARELFAGTAFILGVTLLAAPVIVGDPAGGSWVALLYLFPVLGAAQLYGLRGGVMAASLSGLAYLGAAWLGRATSGEEAAVGHLLPLYAQLLLLSPVGAYLGKAREREHRLHRELSLHHRLLRQDLLRVVQALTSAVEAKDSYTEGHLKRVADYAVAVARRLGMSGRQLENVYYAAMLHDIGKIAVPESVLRKAGSLAGHEADAMREHPAVGARIVEGLDLLRDAAPLILHHQERWDGGGDATYPGYPDGLSGEAIPLGARVIAVVDAFDAMTTDRPYRPARSPADAVMELEMESGRQFDPRVVSAFLAVLTERPWG